MVAGCKIERKWSNNAVIFQCSISDIRSDKKTGATVHMKDIKLRLFKKLF